MSMEVLAMCRSLSVRLPDAWVRVYTNSPSHSSHSDLAVEISSKMADLTHFPLSIYSNRQFILFSCSTSGSVKPARVFVVTLFPKLTTKLVDLTVNSWTEVEDELCAVVSEHLGLSVLPSFISVSTTQAFVKENNEEMRRIKVEQEDEISHVTNVKKNNVNRKLKKVKSDLKKVKNDVHEEPTEFSSSNFNEGLSNNKNDKSQDDNDADNELMASVNNVEEGDSNDMRYTSETDGDHNHNLDPEEEKEKSAMDTSTHASTTNLEAENDDEPEVDGDERLTSSEVTTVATTMTTATTIESTASTTTTTATRATVEASGEDVKKGLSKVSTKGRLKDVKGMKCRSTLADLPRVTCHFCGKLYSSASIKQHINYVHLKKIPRNFKCRLCSKTFRNNYTLNIHFTRAHTDEKPFCCIYCGKTYKAKYGVMRCQRACRGEFRFHCPYCQKGYCEKQYLKKHLRSHTGERPFVCPVCNFRCSQIGNLRVHMRGKHKMEPEEITQSLVQAKKEKQKQLEEEEQETQTLILENYKAETTPPSTNKDSNSDNTIIVVETNQSEANLNDTTLIFEQQDLLNNLQ